VNDFFGLPIPPDGTLALVWPLCLAVLAGGLVGLEREVHGHPAGLRTHILVCLGSALVTVVGVRMAGPSGDPSRIAAQVVTGVGFLGAGAIIREGASIRGLTTAASIWATAAIGIAVGASPKLAELGVAATAIALFTLWVLHLFEKRLEDTGTKTRTIELRMAPDAGEALSQSIAIVARTGSSVEGIRTEHSGGEERRVVLRVKLARGMDRSRLLGDLAQSPGVQSISLD
jgi:putative Mg2+ transporter-C (MgtC) family protein